MKPTTYGVNDILNAEFKLLEDVEPWVQNTLGVLPDPFHIQVIGRPKNGKTSFVMRLVKSLAVSGYTTWYNSKEEGKCKTIQDAYRLAKMKDVAGMVMLGQDYYFNDMMDYLAGPGKRKKIVVIDSLDYVKLTKKQYIKLTEAHPRKSFIVVCWGQRKGKEFVCDDYYGNQLKYMMGSIVGVEGHIVESKGRYGPTEPFALWPEKYPLRRKSNQQQISW
jgi:hypothetical protein